MEAALGEGGLTKERLKAIVAEGGENAALAALILKKYEDAAASKAAALGTRLLAGALNTIAIFAVVQGVSLLVKAISDYQHKAENLAKEAEEIKSKITSANKTLSDMTETVDAAKERFAELSKGVSDTGKNLKLSESEYKEYLEISQKLADTFPELINGYSDQGDALILLGESYDSISEKLDAIIEKQKTVAKQTLIDGLPTLAENTYSQVNQAELAIKGLKQELDSLHSEESQFSEDLISDVSAGLKAFDISTRSGFSSEQIEEMYNAAEKAGVRGLTQNDTSILFASADQDKFIEAVISGFTNPEAIAKSNKLKKDIAAQEQTIKDLYSGMNTNLTTWAQDTYQYDFLDENTKKIADGLIDNIDWNAYAKGEIDGKIHNLASDAEYEEYIKTQILDPLVKVPEEHRAEIDEAMGRLLNFNADDLSIVDFAEQLQARLNELGITINIMPLVADQAEVKNRLQNNINDLTSGDGYAKHMLEDYTSGFTKEQVNMWLEVTAGINNAYDAVKAYENALVSAPEEPKRISLSSWQQSDSTFDNGDKKYSNTDAIEKYKSDLKSLKELKDQIESDPISFNASDFIQTVGQSDIFKQLGMEADEYVNKYDDIDVAINEFINDSLTKFQEKMGDTSSIENFNLVLEGLIGTVKQAKGEFTFGLSGDVIADTQKLSDGLDQLKDVYADLKNGKGFDWTKILNNQKFKDTFKGLGKTYDDFIDTITKANGKMTPEAQQAFDDIVSDYITKSDVMTEVTSDEADTIISILTSMGIKGADALVNEAVRFNKENEKLLDEAEKEYVEHLDDEYKADVAFLNSVGTNNNKLQVLLGKAYAKDYENWCDALTAKAEAYNEFVDALGGEYNEGEGVIQNLVSNGKQVTMDTITNAYAKKAAYDQATQAADKAEKVVRLRLKKASRTKFGGKFAPSTNGGTTGGNNGGSDAEQKDTREQIDWIERALNALQSTIDLTKSKFETLFSFKSKDNNLKKQITDTTKLLKAESIAVNKYKSEYDKYVKKGTEERTGGSGKNKKSSTVSVADILKKNNISEKDIQEGRLKGTSKKKLIQKYGSEDAKIIKEAMDRWDKYQDAEKAYFDKLAEVMSDVQARLDNVTDEYDKQRAKFEHNNSLLESKYDRVADSDPDTKNKNLDDQLENAKEIKKLNTKEYNEKKSQQNSYKKSATTALSKTSSKKLSKANKNKIKAAMKKGEEIDDSLLKKVYDAGLFDLHAKLIKYNSTVNPLTEALYAKEESDEEYETTKYNNKIEKRQNRADAAAARSEKWKAYEANGTNAKEKNKYEQKSLKNIKTEYKWLKEIAKYKKDAVELAKLEQEEIKAIAESYATMFDNIEEYYGNLNGLLGHGENLLSGYIKQAELLGNKSTQSYINGQKDLTQQQIANDTAKLAEENAKLDEYLANGGREGREEWWKMKNAINATEEAILNNKNALLEYEKQLKELKWEEFDEGIERINQMSDELSFMYDLLNQDKFYTKNPSYYEISEQVAPEKYGAMTDVGMAALGLKTAQYQTYTNEIGRLKGEVDAAFAAYQKSQSYDDYKRYVKLVGDYQNAVKGSKSAWEGIGELIKGQLESLKSALSEISSEYETALDQAKDLHDYQKSIKEKTTNITNLNAQIQALSGDNSEENRNRLQELFSNLADAEEDLQETEYDQWRKDQSSMLSNMQDNLEKYIDSLDMDSLIREEINTMNKNTTDLKTAIDKAGSQYGYKSQYATNIISGMNGNSGVSLQTSVDTGCKNIVDEVYKSYHNNNLNQNENTKDAEDHANDGPKNGGGNNPVPTTGAGGALNYVESLFGNSVTVQEASKEDKALDFIQDNLHDTTKKKDELCDINKALYSDKANFYSGTKKVLNQSQLESLCSILGITYDGKDKNSKLYKKLTQMGVINGFAHGGRIDEKDGIDLKDLGVRASNGDTKLVPVQNKEGILTEKQTDAVEDLAITLKDGSVLTPYQGTWGFSEEQLASFKSNALNGAIGFAGMNQFGMPMADVVHNNNTSQNVSVSMGDIVMNGVQDTEAFAKELKSVMNNDRSVQKVTQSITVDLLAGKNSLAGRKYR